MQNIFNFKFKKPTLFLNDNELFSENAKIGKKYKHHKSYPDRSHVIFEYQQFTREKLHTNTKIHKISITPNRPIFEVNLEHLSFKNFKYQHLKTNILIIIMLNISTLIQILI